MNGIINNNQIVKSYPPAEERVNILSHAVGLFLSIIALFLLLEKTISESLLNFIAVTIYGLSLVLLYIASTIYHSSKKPTVRNRLRVFDHASIYVLIAGTYTPFALITLNGTLGWVIFSFSWMMALIGMVLKLVFTGKYNGISTLMYIFMGWMIVFFIGPLVEVLPSNGVVWLFLGGVLYTLGAIIYGIKNIKFNHAVFHVFVLLGSFSHFISVYFYVLS